MNFSVKVLMLSVLFECKLLKSTFKAIFYISNAWTFLKKVDELSFLVISEINNGR